MTETNENRPLNCEEGLMHLLGLKTVEDLNRVLSESPDERVLETLGPPEELYALEEEDDCVHDTLYEIEEAERNGTEALFAPKDGGIMVLLVTDPAPSTLRLVRDFYGTNHPILPKSVRQMSKFGSCQRLRGY